MQCTWFTLQEAQWYEAIELKNIFEPSAEGSRPYRLLIEAAPGMGKSTLCKRLMGSWSLGVRASCPASASNPQAASHDELEGSRLHDYLLVFYLRVRELRGEDLVENLLSNLVHDCWREKDSNERLVQCIRDNIKDVLIVIDGYDKGDITQQKAVNGWLRGQGCRGCTIIVTSRPGFRHPTLLLDKTYKLQGLDEKKQIKFAKSFDEIMDKELGENSAAEYLRQLEHRDFLQTPLLLELVFILAKQGQEVLPKNVTGLYTKFVEFLCEKAMHGSPNFAKDHVSKLQNLLPKIAFHLFDLKQSEMTSDILSKHVEKSDIDKTIEETMIDLFKFGLVCQQNKIKDVRNNQTGTFLHQSFLDYFAANHFVLLSKEERSALLKKLWMHENILVFVAGLFGEREEHRECFRQMMEAWKRAVKREQMEEGKWCNIDHPVEHASLLWVGELEDPAWLHADHVTDINQTLEGIRLDRFCSTSCFRGVTALVRCAAQHHDSLSSPSAQQRPSHSAQQRPGPSAQQRPSPSAQQRPSHSAQQRPSHSAQQRPSPLQRIRSALSRQLGSLSSRELLNLELTVCPPSALSALCDLLHPSLPPNVKLTCGALTLPGCLTGAECERLAAVLPSLTDLEVLEITVSSLTELTTVSVGFNSTSLLRRLTVYCSRSSPRDASSAAAEPWSPSDELIDNICCLSALEEITLWDNESTLTTEDRRDFKRPLAASHLQGVDVRIYDWDLQTGYTPWEDSV